MNYPIVSITTPDNLLLHGLFLESETNNETSMLYIHGTASNFYCDDFIEELTTKVLENNISVLSVNNRGAGIGESWQKTGAAVEKFEDCVTDIDCWIEFLQAKGYTKITLCGHSLGTEKVVHYMSKGKYVDKVIGVILLGFADSFGTQYKFLQTQNTNPMSEAQELVKNGKSGQYLTSIWLSHAGVLPKSAESYINFFSENSELSKAFPLRQGKDLIYYQKINVPILGVISDGEEYTVIPTDEASELLKSKNKNAEIYKIENTDHNFTGKEKELAEVVVDFVKKKICN